MARRNVWRNQRRSVVTVGAMTLALVAMMLYAGLMEGYIRSMERNVLDLEVGDMQLFAGDYRENPDIYTRIQQPDAVLSSLQEAGYPATGRLLGFGLAANEEASAGVSLRGIDVSADALVSGVHQELMIGEWLEPDDDKGVVLGRRLARTLAVAPGDEILVLSQGADGSMAYDLFTVRGVLRGIADATDRTGMFMTQAAFRELMVVPDGVHQIIVRRPSDVELASAALRVSEVVADLEVNTWRDLMPTVATMIDSARGLIFIMFIIFYLAVAILILNAMLMAVFERIREIGVLKALGVGPFDVLRLIGTETAIQTGLAVAIGLVLGIPGLLLLQRYGIDMSELVGGVAVMGIAMDPIWRGHITSQVILGPVFTLVGIVAIAVIYPALKAALIEPVEAIHHH
jgi:ABC-type lipoprotein release transport system permease subunit